MALPYNLTFTENMSMMGMVRGVNLESNFLFVGMLLLSLFIIMFMTFKKYDTRAALLTSGFLTLLLGIGFRALGLIKTGYVAYPVILFIVCLIAYIFWPDT